MGGYGTSWMGIGGSHVGVGWEMGYGTSILGGYGEDLMGGYEEDIVCGCENPILGGYRRTSWLGIGILWVGIGRISWVGMEPQS